jgi:thiamine-monophosphate kinase
MMSDQIALGPGREFDAIRAMVERWGVRARGIGDDAAVLTVPRGDALVASVDSAIEGRHFRREWLTPREIGYRAAVAALSDLAAMAARPLGLLVALAVPAPWRDALPAIADGIGDALEGAHTVILGGNLADADALSITTTVLGAVYEPLRRSGARVGDRVYVTGRLGGPAAAIAALAGGREPVASLRESFAHPTPRLAAAIWLADHGVTAAIDVSDGLAGDLAHLASASSVSIDVDVERIPVAEGADTSHAVRGGEDYELIVTCPHDLDIEAFERRFAIPLTPIGRVSAATRAASVVLRLHGERVANPLGHDHFS